MNSPNAAQRSLEAPNNVGDLPDDCLLRPSVSKVPGVNAGSTRSIGQHGGAAELEAWDAMEKSSAVGRFRDVKSAPGALLHE
ncbi:hypothetical protein M422DRAFT_273440 [Sphaerobolus stellatus SS14]|uniref:Uncharacterized protein n=1 Tax=Sphaerobolus stellatus (strain SS14) TaxID=990650 RepID=A0A0C9U947_SPHS4|nr:hypothetical protein M422DRAFT_273440 [Sphaerobolus stellatus SS14]